jgi:hypothetical protein
MESSESNDFNRRQLRLMADEIARFRREEIMLRDLVKRLKGLYWVLDSPNEEWGEKFLSEWGGLEALNAISLHREEQGQISSEGKGSDTYVRSSRVIEALERIDGLIQGQLQK